MKIYKYDTQTKEFIQELEINEAYGTNLPFTTTVKPLAKKEGFAVCFDGTEWEYIENNRNTVVYNKETKEESEVDYLGKIKECATISKPEQFDIWDYSSNSWIEDIKAKRIFEINTQITEAKQYLADTGWYVERLHDPSSGKAIPEEVLTRRAEAREVINTLEAELATIGAE